MKNIRRTLVIEVKTASVQVVHAGAGRRPYNDVGDCCRDHHAEHAHDGRRGGDKVVLRRMTSYLWPWKHLLHDLRQKAIGGKG